MKEPCKHHAPEKVINIDAWDYWAEREKKGLQQRQCPTCLRWYFHGEFGKGWKGAIKFGDSKM